MTAPVRRPDVPSALGDALQRIRILEAVSVPSGDASLSHADILSSSDLWFNGSSSATLASGSKGYISFEPGDNTPLITNDTTTFTLDQYQSAGPINPSDVYGLGVHTVGTYDFFLNLLVISDAAQANGWQYSVEYQVANFVNSELGGGNWNGATYLTFIGYSGTKPMFGFCGLQRIAISDTDGGSPTPAPITVQIINDTGFTIRHSASSMSVTKIADDDTGI